MALPAVKVSDCPCATLVPFGGAVMVALLGAWATQEGFTEVGQVVAVPAPEQPILAVPRAFRLLIVGLVALVWQVRHDEPEAR